MSSGGGDSESASTKKKGRGPTNIKGVINQSNKEVKFDTLGRAVINEKTTSFSTQLGISVRAHVPVCYRQWPDVPDSIKEIVWQDMKLGWKLPDDDIDLKNDIISHMGVMFRRFRRTLNKDFLKKGVSPFDIYKAIEPHDWADFVEYHQSEEFECLSRQGKENQENNLYPHFLGNRGYKGEKFQKRLKEKLKEIAKEGIQSDLSSCGSTSELSEEQLIKLEVEHRHVSWKLAREKVLHNGEHVHPNPETKEMIKTIEEQESAFKEGTLTPDRYDDILQKSLKNPEHPGRVRGVGSLVGIKKAYAGCGKRKRHTNSESEASIQQRIQREVAERMKPFMEMMERMKPFTENNKMASLMGLQIHVEDPASSSTGAVQSPSSCPSVQPTHFVDFIEEERRCKLHLVRDGQKIQVAVGTIYAGTVVHGRPVPPGHARVMVDDYATGEDETHVPVPNDEVVTLRSARSSFTAWPKDMISLDEEPRKELQVPTSEKVVHSDGFEERDQYKEFEGINFDQLGPTFKSLRDRFVNQVGNAFHIDLPIDLFHSEDPIFFHADDLRDLLTPETMLTGPIIQIFMMYAHKYYQDEYPNELIGFMDPGKTCAQFLKGDHHDRQSVEEYITKALKENRDKKIIFLPYHEDIHWILIALMPRESTFYVFDSISVRSPKKVYKIFKALEGPILTDSCTGGPGKTRWKRSNVKCPQQVESWECGYYVMLFVYDIITRFLDIFPNLTDFPKEYTGTNIDYMRRMWGKYFLKEVLGVKSNSI